MSVINENVRIVDIENIKSYAKWLMYKVVPSDKPAVEMTLKDLLADQPTWNMESVIYGLSCLDGLAATGNIMYDVYEPEECLDDPEKADIKIFLCLQSSNPQKNHLSYVLLAVVIPVFVRR